MASKKSSKKTPKDNPDAVVYNGKHRVRVYTIEQHGEDYVDLAKQYTSHPDRENFTVKFETVKTRISCPNCSHKFRI